VNNDAFSLADMLVDKNTNHIFEDEKILKKIMKNRAAELALAARY
jgi:hypothetical protein